MVVDLFENIPANHGSLSNLFIIQVTPMENGPGLKMYFLLEMVIFQPAMLVYQRVR